jgi:hypothetical protein
MAGVSAQPARCALSPSNSTFRLISLIRSVCQGHYRMHWWLATAKDILRMDVTSPASRRATRPSSIRLARSREGVGRRANSAHRQAHGRPSPAGDGRLALCPRCSTAAQDFDCR